MNLVLVPGFMADASLWDDMLPALETIGPVTYGDLSQASTIAEMARAVLHNAPGRFALVGFSMGGYVAREIVRLEPERVQALVLVATSARADTPEQARSKATAAMSMDTAAFRGLSRKSILSSLHPDRSTDEVMIERVRAMGDRLGGEVFARQAAQLRQGDLDRLTEIRCRTLIVAADTDALRSLEEAQELCAGIAKATMVIIECSGHMIPIEAPAALSAVIVRWLSRQGKDVSQ